MGQKQSKKAARPTGKAAKPAAKSAAKSAAPLGAQYAAGPVHPLGVQPKVAIGKPNDRYEREADVVADHVVRAVPAPMVSPIGPAGLQRQEAGEEEEPELQTFPVQRQGVGEEEEPELQTFPVQRQEVGEEEEPELQTFPVQRQEVGEEEEPELQTFPVQRQEVGEEEEPELQTFPVQRQEVGEEEEPELQTFPVQRQEVGEEEEPELQTFSVQRQEVGEEEEPELQTFPVQRQEVGEEEEPELQTFSVQRQEVGEEEEPELQTFPVQRQEVGEEEEPELQTFPVQRQEVGEEEEPELQTFSLQRQEMGEEEEPDALQRSEGPGSAASMQSAAAGAIQNTGGGSPLASPTRQSLEHSLGRDLSDVRVHDDSAAQRAASDLNARAFTHGSNIWLGPGESQQDLRLMGHEAAHVLQQTGSVHRQIVQRASRGGRRRSGSGGGAGGGVSIKGNTIHIPEITLPDFREDNKDKSKIDKPLKHKYPRPTDQRDVWKKDAIKNIKVALENKLKPKEVTPVRPAGGGKPYYYFRLGGSYVFGTQEMLADTVVLPWWDRDGKSMRSYHGFHVDHMHEMQLGGANKYNNMELLNASANTSSGSKIAHEVERRITKALVPAHVGPGKEFATEADADPKKVRQKYLIYFESVSTDPPLPVKKADGPYYSRQDIIDGAPLDPLIPIGPEEIENAGLRKKNTDLLLFPTTASRPRCIPMPAGRNEAEIKGKQKLKIIRPLIAEKVVFDPGKESYIQGVVKWTRDEVVKSKRVKWGINEMPDLGYAGVIDKTQILESLPITEVEGMSPLRFDMFDVDPEVGLIAHGILTPTLPFVRSDLSIDVDIRGTDIMLSKTFTGSEIKLPGPVQITGSSLTVYINAGELDIGAEGRVDFEIQKAGKGFIAASASARGGIALEGQFNFDSRLFDRAEVNLAYRDGEFSGRGVLTIGDGKVTGIRSARLDVAITSTSWTATGTVEPKVPGVRQGTLTASFSEKEGFAIGGELQLDESIPGIRSGKLTAAVREREGGDGYMVSASGRANLDIPGVDATIDIAYEDGGIRAQADLSYERGRLSGSLTIGATNQAVGEDGQPAGPPTDNLTIYGSGTLTLRITPWLEGSATVRLRPDGEIEVLGRIGLPDTLELFPERRYDRNIFTIGIDIPIFGVAVAGQRIGIFANISGGLDLSAGFGPGVLRDTEITVFYNPSREEETRVTGSATFAIPAHAGLRLFVRGSLGVGIPIVSASLGLEIGGQLGLQGEATASAQVEWTPQQGLVLDARGSITVQPKFTFDITGFALVEADLLLTTIELYSKRWQLASFEYGSNMQFGVAFPIHYAENEPFDISFDDVEFTYPDIDAGSVLRGLIDRVV